MTYQIVMKFSVEVPDSLRNIVSKFEPDPRWLKKRQISKGYPLSKNFRSKIKVLRFG